MNRRSFLRAVCVAMLATFPDFGAQATLRLRPRDICVSYGAESFVRIDYSGC